MSKVVNGVINAKLEPGTAQVLSQVGTKLEYDMAKKHAFELSRLKCTELKDEIISHLSWSEYVRIKKMMNFNDFAKQAVIISGLRPQVVVLANRLITQCREMQDKYIEMVKSKA